MNKGLTLIEVIILVLILAIIAAIVIPSLIKSKIAANEGAASGSMKTFNGMFTTYKKKRYSGSGLYPVGLEGVGATNVYRKEQAGKYCGLYYETGCSGAGERLTLIGAAEASADARAGDPALAANGTTMIYAQQGIIGSFHPIIFVTTWLPQPAVTFEMSDKQGYWFALMRQMTTSGFTYGLNASRNCFAICAFPADYGSSGENTFIMNEEGTVYAKDLGKGTYIDRYPGLDPGVRGWKIAQ